MCDKETCPFKSDIERNTKDISRNFNGIERNEKDIHLLDKEQARTDVQYENIINSIKDLSKKVESLLSKPAKKWDKLTFGVIMVVVSGLVSWIIAFLGG